MPIVAMACTVEDWGGAGALEASAETLAEFAEGMRASTAGAWVVSAAAAASAAVVVDSMVVVVAVGITNQ
jgi:hypothetical protein